MTNPNSSTVSGEHARQAKQLHGKAIFRGLQQRIGTVTEVHPTLPMVKVQFITGANAVAGDFIPVGHSVLDILQRFGALRVGLRALVTYFGEVESAAIVTIIGVEGEKLGAEIQQDNDMDTPAYSLFSPGGL